MYPLTAMPEYLSSSRHIHAAHSTVNGRNPCQCGHYMGHTSNYPYDYHYAMINNRYFVYVKKHGNNHTDVSIYEHYCWFGRTIFYRTIFHCTVDVALKVYINQIGDNIVVIADYAEIFCYPVKE